jgi:hypothetical protein
MDKLTKIKLKWLNDNFNLDKMKMYKHDYYPNSIFYKKGDIFVINQDLKTKKFWIDYNQIWSFFESFFGMEYTEIQSIMNIWLEETDKLREYTPEWRFDRTLPRLEETDKLREYTPQICHSHLNFVLEETDKLREYTPQPRAVKLMDKLEETDKLSEYTPLGLFYPTPYLLEDTDKLREYTPKQ